MICAPGISLRRSYSCASESYEQRGQCNQHRCARPVQAFHDLPLSSRKYHAATRSHHTTTKTASLDQHPAFPSGTLGGVVARVADFYRPVGTILGFIVEFVTGRRAERPGAATRPGPPLNPRRERVPDQTLLRPWLEASRAGCRCCGAVAESQQRRTSPGRWRRSSRPRTPPASQLRSRSCSCLSRTRNGDQGLAAFAAGGSAIEARSATSGGWDFDEAAGRAIEVKGHEQQQGPRPAAASIGTSPCPRIEMCSARSASATAAPSPQSRRRQARLFRAERRRTGRRSR